MKYKYKYKYIFLAALLLSSWSFAAGPPLIASARQATVISVVQNHNTNRCYAKNTISSHVISAGLQAGLGALDLGSYSSYAYGVGNAVGNTVTSEQLAECTNQVNLFRIKYRSPFTNQIIAIDSPVRVSPGQLIMVIE